MTRKPVDAVKDIYVDYDTGDDSNPGTKDKPVKTMDGAVALVPKNIGPGNVTYSLCGNFRSIVSYYEDTDVETQIGVLAHPCNVVKR